MKQKEKQNLVRSTPLYLICLLLIAAIAVRYWQKPPAKSEPLADSIAHYLENGAPKEFLTLDDVINDRTTWQPILAGSIGKQVEDFEFTDVEGKSRRLSDFAGGPVLLLLWATWSPACTMQLEELQQLRTNNPGLMIVAFSSESEDTLKRYGKRTQATLMLIRQQEPLPDPLAEVSDIPSSFFIERHGQLFLAAKGLVPFEHADAILKFMEPKSNEPTLKP